MTIILLKAVDWAVYSTQVSRDEDFQVVTGWIAGMLWSEDAEKLVIAHHAFVGGDLRHVSVIPRVNVVAEHRFALPEVMID